MEAGLTLSHGQAGFSPNNNIITFDRTLINEKTIKGLRTVKDLIREYGKVEKVPMSFRVLQAVRGAYNKYQ